jgi:hypothetical protein
MQLLSGFLKYARVQNYLWYPVLAGTALRGPWRKAIFLDVLLADVFAKEVRRTNPHFASLFLNAGAHIQHHYMFSAACYSGEQRNPDWYLSAEMDPVGEVYAAYDRILGSIRTAFPSSRIMIATGLHQEPHGRVTYYWRLRDHAEFLRKIEVPFDRVEPRMSRDFLIACASPSQAKEAETRLSQAATLAGLPLFEVDNRGSDLFVMLTYPDDIDGSLEFLIQGKTFSLSQHDVAFVALKNGEHSGIGYFLDTGKKYSGAKDAFALAEIPSRIADALGLQLPLGLIR